MFERKILGRVHCTRCNAVAQLRVDIKPQLDDRLLVYLVCDKCKLVKYQYSTSKKFLAAEERILKMEWQLAAMDPESTSADALRGRIAEARRRQSRSELGL